MRRPEFVARQSACPSGPLGRLIGRIMAHETAGANRFALELLDLHPSDHVLEVGFGHGATIARAAAAVSGGLVAGVDPSAEMCRMAARRNKRAVDDARVELHQALADALPYPDQAFEKVLTAHTLYFWPDLGAPFREMARVLKAGGRLVVVHRTDRGAEGDFPPPIYRFPTDDQLGDALRDAGLVPETPIHRHLGAATVPFRVARR